MALETFRAQLKAKAKTLGVTNLSNKRIDAYAAVLDKQNPDLKTDDDHAEKVDAFLELIDIKEIAAYDDYKATKARKDGKTDAKTDPEKKDPEKKETVETSNDDANVPDYMKKFMEKFEAVAETVTKLQQKETRASVQSRLKETLKDIPASFYEEWTIPEKDDDFEPFTEKVKTKWEAFTKDNPIQQKGGHQPSRGSGKTTNEPTKEELDALIKDIM